MLRKVLVANRGEIAVRILRACREMGIGTVTVHSDPDAFAPYVRLSDETYALGGSRSADTYLRMDKLLDVARRAGCDAVHPGYGFLSERAEFARAVADAGLAFVGPPAAAIEALGNKLAARRKAAELGVPVLPGTDGGVAADAPDLASRAEKIGYPLLVKAAAGGGGKGMRVVRTAEELPAAVRQAASEAGAAFGDGTVYLERWLERPRHVEVQVLADAHGNLVHLGERECSIQRRHQKLIEESPSPAVEAGLRARLGEAALAVAKSAGYVNAGTVEFLVQGPDFWFLEMNTRLQVEHPVTEMVTGVDLVREQLRVAAGERLSFTQDQVRLTGHAIECRICAEDPDAGFVPSPGLVAGLKLPGGPFVRVDSGVEQRSEVTLFYDSLLAKLVVWGRDRAEAVSRMERALAEFLVVGLRTTIPFHRRILAHPRFRAGELSVRFIEEELDGAPEAPDADLAALLACAMEHAGRRATRVFRRADGPSQWTLAHRRRLLERR